MEYIDVKNQAELDAIDENTVKIIRIKSRRNTQISVSKRYRYRVEAHGNSSVEAYENSSVEAHGNSQVNDKSKKGKVKVFENARVVYDPETIDEYIRFYDLKTEGDTVHLFKAVHKRDGVYFSHYANRFRYEIGHAAVARRFDNDREEKCGAGIHMAHLNWCLDFGRGWEDLAILEVTANKSSILVPKGGCGKVRATKATVVREVPLEDCGLYGKILAKRRSRK